MNPATAFIGTLEVNLCGLRDALGRTTDVAQQERLCIRIDNLLRHIERCRQDHDAWYSLGLTIAEREDDLEYTRACYNTVPKGDTSAREALAEQWRGLNAEIARFQAQRDAIRMRY